MSDDSCDLVMSDTVASVSSESRFNVIERINAFEFLSFCHLPLYFRARIREMRVGDTFIIGSIRNVYEDFNDYEGLLEIFVVKEPKGLYIARSHFTFITKPERAATFTEFTFKIEKGGIWLITGNPELSARNRRSFALACRYFERLSKAASDDEVLWFREHGIPRFLSGVTVDSDLKTRNTYLKRYGCDKSPSNTLTRYVFSVDMMPKTMMESILDLAVCHGVFDELQG